MAISGKTGMTKAAKKAFRLSQMVGSRKQEKASARARYHGEFKRCTGYPRQGKKKSHGCPPVDRKLLGFTGLRSAL